MKICTFEGCERKYSAKGYCKVHNNILKKEGVVREIGRVGASIKKHEIKFCSIEGCQRIHLAKGFCKSHWSQQHYNREVGFIRARVYGRSLCSIFDCSCVAHSQGYCQKHYWRLRTNGTTDLLPKTNKPKKCSQIGCDTNKHNGGYCFKHYREIILKIQCKGRGGHNKKPKQKCDVDNCDYIASSKGFCHKHYGRYRRHGDPLTCYRRPRKSSYISIDNIMKDSGNYSKIDDEEILNDNFNYLHELDINFKDYE